MEITAKPISVQQIVDIDLILNDLNLIEARPAFVKEYTRGRALNIQDLTHQEAQKFLTDLYRFDSVEAIKATVTKMYHSIGALSAIMLKTEITEAISTLQTTAELFHFYQNHYPELISAIEVTPIKQDEIIDLLNICKSI